MDVDGDGAVLDGGINAGDQAFYDAVAGVNGGRLAGDDVFGLGFWNFDLGFEALGIGDAGEVLAGLDVLADFDGNDLENSADACANVEGIELAFLEIVESTLLIDFGLLRLDASAGGVFRVFGAIIFELGAHGELLFLNAGELLCDVCANALLAKLYVDFVLNFGLLVFAANRSGGGFLVEEIAVDGDLEAFEIGLCGFELIFGIEGFALENGIAEFDDDAIGLDDGARVENDFIDARIGLRGDPLDIFGDEGADAANVADHGPALDLVGPDGGLIDGGRGGTKTRDAEGDAGEKDGGDTSVEDATYFFGACVRWSLYVHDCSLLCYGDIGRSAPGESPEKRHGRQDAVRLRTWGTAVRRPYRGKPKGWLGIDRRGILSAKGA